MIAARIRRAAHASLALTTFELGFAHALAWFVARPLAEIGSAFVDPHRLGPALSELGDKAARELVWPLSVAAFFTLAYAFLEPVLFVAYARAHRDESDRLEHASHGESAIGLVGVRLVVTIAVAVVLALLAVVYAVIHVVARDHPDPRLHTIPNVIVVAIGAVFAGVAYVALELASVEAAVSKPRPFESILLAWRAFGARPVAVRAALVLASLGVGVASVIATDATTSATLSFVVLLGATALRTALRSAWFAYALDRRAKVVPARVSRP